MDDARAYLLKALLPFLVCIGQNMVFNETLDRIRGEALRLLKARERERDMTGGFTTVNGKHECEFDSRRTRDSDQAIVV
eukprot:1194600-Prorocentrum_minimum.AAC.6